MFERLRRNLSFGLRLHARTPLVTTVIVCTLAIGIAATSVAFSLMNAFFIRPLPVREPDRLVRIYQQQRGGIEYFPISYREFEDMRALRHVFDNAIAEQPIPISLGLAGANERVWGESVSDRYFASLGVTPALGRFFAPDEEEAGAAVVVLGHGLWARRFGSDPGVIGRTLRVDGTSFRVIGVAPRSFHGTILSFTADLWVPARSRSRRGDELTDRNERAYFSLARMSKGVSVAQARAAIDALALRLRREYPDANRGVRFAVLQETDGRVPPSFRGSVLGFSALAVVTALLVTVIACANVAGVLLARAVARRREMGVRLALGATRRVLLGQLLTEAGLLSILAGILGVAVAWRATGVISAIQIPLARGAVLSLDVSPDARVLAVSLAVTMLSTILFGMAPALEASSPDLVGVLKDAGGPDGRRRVRTRRAFLASQVAVSMVLLTGCGLFLHSLAHARQIDLGFDPTNVVTTAVDIRAREYSSEERRRFWSTLVDEVRRLPGIESASVTYRLPLELGVVLQRLAPEGFQPAAGEPWPAIEFSGVDSDYFRTLRIQMIDGRGFTERDTIDSPTVVVLNDVAAERFWPRARATGRYVMTPAGDRFQVVGVVRRSKYLSVGEDPKPYAYFAMRQGADLSRAMTIVARGPGDPAARLRAIAATVQRLEPLATLYDVGPMSSRVALSLAPTTSAAASLAVIGMIALGLTSLGLFAAVAHAVSRRTYEIGVRRALGAQDGDVMWLVIRDQVAVVLIGLAGGTLAALAASPFLGALTYGWKAADPVIFAVVPVVLVAVCTAAAWLPARRAVRISASAALRQL